MPKVTVINTQTDEKVEIKFGYGANLRQAILFKEQEIYKGINKYLNCRGMGLCATCVVEIEPEENVSDRTLFETVHRLEPHQRLACRTKVYGDITVKTAIQD